jgi:hypothetical protein
MKRVDGSERWSLYFSFSYSMFALLFTATCRWLTMTGFDMHCSRALRVAHSGVLFSGVSKGLVHHVVTLPKTDSALYLTSGRSQRALVLV